MSLLKTLNYQIELVTKEITEVKARLERLQTKKYLMLSLQDICPSCEGSGEETYTDAAGSKDYRDCTTCKGVGKVTKATLNQMQRYTNSSKEL